MTLRPCLDCSEPTDATRCPDCQTQHNNTRNTSPRERGYDAAWEKLSKRLRKTACCSVCGTREDLQLDHLPGAWERVAKGLRLRPGIDVDVKCGRHNREAGARRSLKTWPGDPGRTRPVPPGKAQRASHTTPRSTTGGRRS